MNRRTELEELDRNVCGQLVFLFEDNKELQKLIETIIMVESYYKTECLLFHKLYISKYNQHRRALYFKQIQLVKKILKTIEAFQLGAAFKAYTVPSPLNSFVKFVCLLCSC